MSFQTFLYVMTLVQLCLVPMTGGDRTNYCIDNPTLGTNFKSKAIESVTNLITSLTVSHHTEHIYIVEHPGILFVLRKSHNVKERIFIDKCDAVGSAVDGRAPTVYVSCTAERGILTYDERTDQIKSFLPKVDSIWQLYVPRNTSNVYTVNYNSHEVYLYHENSTVGVKLNFLEVRGNFRYHIAVDGDGNHFYTTAENEMPVTKILLKGLSRPLTYSAGHFENLAVDRKGRVYGTSRDDNGLYRLTSDGSPSRLITPLDFNACHMQFDVNDDIVIGSGLGQIYYMEYDEACFSPLLDQSKIVYNDDNLS